MIVLAINPGSTSTKVAIFKNETLLIDKTIRHTKTDLDKFSSLQDQIPFRKRLITDFLNDNNFKLKSIDGFI